MKIGIYFDCFSGTILECDLSSEYCSTNDLLAILRANTTGISTTASRHDQFKVYAGYVELYLNRSPRSADEALDACVGVFSDIQKHTGGDCRHLYGILPKFFELSLLWIHVREKGLSSSLDKKQRNQTSPTWSWAGWSSQVSYALPDWIRGLEQEISLSMCCQLNPHRIPEDEHLSFTMLPEQISDTRTLEFTTSVINADWFSSRAFDSPFFDSGRLRRYGFDAVIGGARRESG
jgi:hypothetical protein